MLIIVTIPLLEFLVPGILEGKFLHCPGGHLLASAWCYIRSQSTELCKPYLCKDHVGRILPGSDQTWIWTTNDPKVDSTAWGYPGYWITLNANVKYASLVALFDICLVEGARRYIHYGNKFWVFNFASRGRKTTRFWNGRLPQDFQVKRNSE